jgi:hypothetical protein
MTPRKGSSFGRAGGRCRRYPGGTGNASIFTTVRGSIPNRRAASRRLSPSIYNRATVCPRFFRSRLRTTAVVKIEAIAERSAWPDS